MVRNKFANENKTYPTKQGWYHKGPLSYHYMRNVVLILVITAALTSLSAHVTDKLLGMGNSHV
ncbi:MAG: hypothetical protein WAK17_15215 [Candidatus Nitrosopolaris sp.]